MSLQQLNRANLEAAQRTSWFQMHESPVRKGLYEVSQHAWEQPSLRYYDGAGTWFVSKSKQQRFTPTNFAIWRGLELACATITVTDAIAWLTAKWERHHEAEDLYCAELLEWLVRRLSAQRG